MSYKNYEPNLWEDLNEYADELYTRGDLEAGKKILQELAGIYTVGLSFWTIFTVGLPALGITFAPASVAVGVARLVYLYSKYGAEDRKAIRAAFKWIRGGFNLLTLD